MRVPPRSKGKLQAQAPSSRFARGLLSAQQFIHTEQNAGIALLVATVLAVAWANSPWRETYFGLLDTEVGVTIGSFSLVKDIQHWVNDGLMAIFFFVVGLEIKRELTHGHLASPRRAALPVAAALGGMIVPAAIYFAFNTSGETARGWGIPMATDIAFALGVLALLGNRVPTDLRLFLLTLAVVDDIGAILVIAIFYTGELSIYGFAGAALALVGIFVLRRLGVRDVTAYILLGFLFWLAILESGVHATIAGVILGLITPAGPFLQPSAFSRSAEELVRSFRSAYSRGDYDQSEYLLGEMEGLAIATEAPVERLERELHPWSSYLILPVFAFANAGVTLSSELLAAATSGTVAIGIAAGLLIGKPVGVFAGTWLATTLRVAELPSGVQWRHVVGVGMLAGIGFTVSLFINDLAFDDPDVVAQAKIGIFFASLVAGLAGYAFLRFIRSTQEDKNG